MLLPYTYTWSCQVKAFVAYDLRYFYWISSHYYIPIFQPDMNFSFAIYQFWPFRVSNGCINKKTQVDISILTFGWKILDNYIPV